LASPELGAKQVCPNCQTKFYDLNRRPAHCPKCGETFDPEEAVRSRRVRARTTTPDYEADEPEVKERDEEAEGFEDEAEDTPELDEAAEAEPADTEEDEGVEPGAATPGEPDLGVDFETETGEDLGEDEEAEDVPFLEDEDEGFPEDEIEGLPNEGEEH
jgi:uncharacterized protein (TIGR02300 family)